MNIFEAAKTGDLEEVRRHINAGVNLEEKNKYGFTALHCAATGTNSADGASILKVIQLLIDSGSPLESIGGGGRTALYLAAEFSPLLDPIELLLKYGANPDVYSEHGIHVVENAMIEEARELLFKLTGVPIPPPPIPEPPDKKIYASEWREIKKVLDEVFDQLQQRHIIAIQDAGTTQEDGFSDCSQIYHENKANGINSIGFCFYSRQDPE